MPPPLAIHAESHAGVHRGGRRTGRAYARIGAGVASGTRVVSGIHAAPASAVSLTARAQLGNRAESAAGGTA